MTRPRVSVILVGAILGACSAVQSSGATSRAPKLKSPGWFLPNPEAMTPGCRQFAVTRVSSRRRASSYVKSTFASFD